METEDTPAVIPVLNESSVNQIKQPKRILYFSDGILEEYDTDEEKVEDQPDYPVVDPNTLTWMPYLWYYMWIFGNKTLNACDLIGESLAYFFGITSPKYQYEIDEYNWLKKQEEEEQQKQNEEEFWKNNEKEAGETIDMQPTTKTDEWER